MTVAKIARAVILAVFVVLVFVAINQYQFINDNRDRIVELEKSVAHRCP